MTGSHTNQQTGEYIAQSLHNIVDKHKLQDKDVALVMDNAANIKLSWRLFAAKLDHCVACFG